MAKEKAVAPTTNAVKKETGKKLGFGQRVTKWMREMRSELKKVIWPTPKETAKKTGVALLVMVISAVVIWLFDSAADAIIQAVITLVG